MKKFFAGTGAVIAIIGLFLLSSPGQQVIASANDLFQKLNVFSDMVSIVNDNYVEDVTWEEVMIGAYNGLMEELDPHSVYIPKKRIDRINEQFEGEFQGIGIEFDIIDKYITVISPIPGAPADKVGIQAGDKIVAIEDTSAEGITQQEVFDKLRGKKGTQVNVTVVRPGRSDSLDFTIIRDDIPIASVLAAVMVPGHEQTGYIRLNRFAKNTATEFEDALKKLESQGMEQLVIDLRNNSGGYMDQAIKIVDKFVEGGQKIVYTKGRIPSANEEFYSTDKATHHRFPVVVVLNRGSASASEIVSGALQDLDRGLIVGETSFGKGLVQRQWPMRDGSAIRVTVARYYTPSGRLIQRPYENGTEDYYEEVATRHSDTEMAAEDSSGAPIDTTDRPVFHTKSGRIVYGGGGITPDIPAEYDLDLTKTTIKLIQHPSRVFFEWASAYAAKHQELKEDFSDFAQNFQLTDEHISDIKDFIAEKDVEIDEEEFEQDLPYIRNLIKAEIASSLWEKDQYYAIRLTMDNQVQTALEHFPQARELAIVGQE
ncbi:MAG: S41 family peptidase [Candidatus Marinimicrobia bacterium]|nr:S41 family peptidase [Candidatus Neomarinimicrobiota bacterium]MCF7827993.1 S41 family peptidase [Candidatus Neomarinimicrobiota bacterium]MCF7879252.1 S41 family peptidase [Candidatus Neomarinimicrobiota bacterium]